MKNYELTRYPALYSRYCWGNYTGRDSHATSSVIEARNRLVPYWGIDTVRTIPADFALPPNLLASSSDIGEVYPLVTGDYLVVHLTYSEKIVDGWLPGECIKDGTNCFYKIISASDCRHSGGLAVEDEDDEDF